MTPHWDDETRRLLRTRRLLVSCQRKGGERVRARLAGKQVRIWSAEHMAWWRPNRAGYTTFIESAGVYNFDDAWNATSHCGPEKRIAFYVIDHTLNIADDGTWGCSCHQWGSTNLGPLNGAFCRGNGITEPVIRRWHASHANATVVTIQAGDYP